MLASLPTPFWHILNIYNGSTFQDPVHYPSLASKYESALEDLHSRHYWSTLKYQVSDFLFLFFKFKRPRLKLLYVDIPLTSQ